MRARTRAVASVGAALALVACVLVLALQSGVKSRADSLEFEDGALRQERGAGRSRSLLAHNDCPWWSWWCDPQPDPPPPASSPTPKASPTPKPSPSASPAANVTASASPSPTPAAAKPTATPTQRPSPTPSATPSATPKPSPSPSRTPAPTATPAPTPTPAPSSAWTASTDPVTGSPALVPSTPLGRDPLSSSAVVNFTVGRDWAQLSAAPDAPVAAWRAALASWAGVQRSAVTVWRLTRGAKSASSDAYPVLVLAEVDTAGLASSAVVDAVSTLASLGDDASATWLDAASPVRGSSAVLLQIPASVPFVLDSSNPAAPMLVPETGAPSAASTSAVLQLSVDLDFGAFALDYRTYADAWAAAIAAAAARTAGTPFAASAVRFRKFTKGSVVAEFELASTSASTVNAALVTGLPAALSSTALDTRGSLVKPNSVTVLAAPAASTSSAPSSLPSSSSSSSSSTGSSSTAPSGSSGSSTTTTTTTTTTTPAASSSSSGLSGPALYAIFIGCGAAAVAAVVTVLVIVHRQRRARAAAAAADPRAREQRAVRAAVAAAGGVRPDAIDLVDIDGYTLAVDRPLSPRSPGRPSPRSPGRPSPPGGARSQRAVPRPATGPAGPRATGRGGRLAAGATAPPLLEEVNDVEVAVIAPLDADADHRKVYSSFECPVCLETYNRTQGRVALVLACGHSLCRGCAAKMGGVDQPPRNCPLCRRPFTVSDLRTNVALMQMLDGGGGAVTQLP